MSHFLLFVHGAASRGAIWQSQLLDFPRSAAPDLPGHPHGQPLDTVEAYAVWLADHVRSSGLAPPVVVGHSMGGAVALQAVLTSPEVFCGLVLVATGPRLSVNPKFLRGLVERPETTLDRFLQLCFGPHAPARVKAKVCEVARAMGPDLLRRDLEACDAYEAGARLREVQLPTLVVCGEQDVMTPPALSEELHRGIAGSTLVVVPEAGHMVFLERRRLFRDCLRTFLATIPVRG